MNMNIRLTLIINNASHPHQDHTPAVIVQFVPSALLFDRDEERLLFSFSPHQYVLVKGKYQALGIPY